MLKRAGFVGLLAALAAAGVFAFVTRRPAEALPVLGTAPAFALTDQEGGTLRAEELAGTVWVAGFIFTNCPDICSTLTQRMAQVRDSLSEQGLLGERVRLVSVSVDPERDTPEVLRAYAAQFGGSAPGAWAFLTGPADVVRKTIEQGFHVPATPIPAAGASAAQGHGEGAAQAEAHAHGAGAGQEGHGKAHDHADAGQAGYTVMHADYLLVYDGEGRLRAIHSGMDPEVVAAVIRDVRALAR